MIVDTWEILRRFILIYSNCYLIIRERHKHRSFVSIAVIATSFGIKMILKIILLRV